MGQYHINQTIDVLFVVHSLQMSTAVLLNVMLAIINTRQIVSKHSGVLMVLAIRMRSNVRMATLLISMATANQQRA